MPSSAPLIEDNGSAPAGHPDWASLLRSSTPATGRGMRFIAQFSSARLVAVPSIDPPARMMMSRRSRPPRQYQHHPAERGGAMCCQGLGHRPRPQTVHTHYRPQVRLAATYLMTRGSRSATFSEAHVKHQTAGRTEECRASLSSE
jgi:hypothetical protein